MTSHANKVTLIASGSEVELALNVHALLKENGIDQKLSLCHVRNFLINSLMNIKKIF